MEAQLTVLPTPLNTRSNRTRVMAVAMADTASRAVNIAPTMRLLMVPRPTAIKVMEADLIMVKVVIKDLPMVETRATASLHMVVQAIAVMAVAVPTVMVDNMGDNMEVHPMEVLPAMVARLPMVEHPRTVVASTAVVPATGAVDRDTDDDERK